MANKLNTFKLSTSSINHIVKNYITNMHKIKKHCTIVIFT